MQRTILMLLTTILVFGCATTDTPIECTGPDAPPVTIHYGDSELWVKPTRADVKRGGNFVFILNALENPVTDPPDVHYKDVKVTVKGKTKADAWIVETSGTWNPPASGHKLRICVPPDQATVEYEYTVTVVEVGYLDPRVKVSP
jgi:hypothetical protein